MSIQDWKFGADANAPQWPIGQDGQPEQAVLAADAFDSIADADLKLSLLTAYGIPCFKHYAKEGGAGKIINGFSGYGAGLYVPASRLEDARDLLNARPEETEDSI